MYFKWYYIVEWGIIEVIKKKIFDDNHNIAIVIQKDEHKNNFYKLNLVNKDLLVKYLPTMNCPYKKYILKTSIVKNLADFPIYDWDEQLYEGAFVITKLNSEFIVQLIASQTIWHTDEYPIKVDTKNKCNNNNCCCKPKNLICRDISISDLEDILELYNSSRTIKRVNIGWDYDKSLNKKDILEIIFPVLIKNKGLTIDSIKTYFQNSSKVGLKIAINTRSIVFVWWNSSVPIKFDLCTIYMNGEIIDIINIDDRKYVVIKWFIFFAHLFNVQFDETCNLYKRFTAIDFSTPSKRQSSVFILVRINDIKHLRWNLSYSAGILSKFISQFNIEVTQSWDKYEMHDLVQNIKQIPRNFKLKIMKYFKIDHWILDKSINEFWKVILEFNDVIFEWKNYQNIIIIGTTDEYDFENLHKNIFKIKIDGKIEIASFKALLILICN